MKIINERKDRKPPTIVEDDIKKADEYWLKILLKLRMAETKTHHNPHSFNFHATETVHLYRLFGLKAGLKHINELTKGFHVATFLSKGSFWYGISEKEYEQRKLEAMQNVINPSIVDYSLTGTKNRK